MRMWLVPTEILCNKHLLGEHVELHMLAGCLRKYKSIKGYVDKGLVQTDMIIERHEQLVDEMIKRKFQHKSNLKINIMKPQGKVNIDNNIKELSNRCSECRKRIAKYV